MVVPGEASEGRDIHYQQHLALVLGQTDISSLHKVRDREIVYGSVYYRRTKTRATGHTAIG